MKRNGYVDALEPMKGLHLKVLLLEFEQILLRTGRVMNFPKYMPTFKVYSILSTIIGASAM